MKSRLLFLALLMLGLWACSSSDDNANNDMQPVNARLSANVNGVLFESVTILDSIEVGTNGKLLNISGTNASNDRISVTIGNFNEPGTYDIFDSFSSLSFRNGSNSELFIYNESNSNGSGILTVTSDDGDEIKGTFSFVASSLGDPNNTVTVTDGQFTAEYFQFNN